MGYEHGRKRASDRAGDEGGHVAVSSRRGGGRSLARVGRDRVRVRRFPPARVSEPDIPVTRTRASLARSNFPPRRARGGRSCDRVWSRREVSLPFTTRRHLQSTDRSAPPEPAILPMDYGWETPALEVRPSSSRATTRCTYSCAESNEEPTLQKTKNTRATSERTPHARNEIVLQRTHHPAAFRFR